ncbi:MAG: esterase-like activity of phytase family protein, partial [Erythrobacter sp.]
RVAGPSATTDPAWRVAGVWRYSADNRHFGGFSALLPVGEESLRAFSDRGVRFTFPEPGSDKPAIPQVELQAVRAGWSDHLWDVESAARDPAGRYWLGFEARHAIHRYTAANAPDGLRIIAKEVDWPDNEGAEAMERLADGSFMILPEGENVGLLYPSDPVAGTEPARFGFRRPAASYAATDLAQLPDGRVLLLMRNTVFALPPFDTLLAMGPPPRAGEVWAPQVVLDLTRAIERENFEGMAVRESKDGRVAVWVVSDDNFSVMQHTLLAKLIFDPAAADE